MAADPFRDARPCSHLVDQLCGHFTSHSSALVDLLAGLRQHVADLIKTVREATGDIKLSRSAIESSDAILVEACRFLGWLVISTVRQPDKTGKKWSRLVLKLLDDARNAKQPLPIMLRRSYQAIIDFCRVEISLRGYKPPNMFQTSSRGVRQGPGGQRKNSDKLLNSLLTPEIDVHAFLDEMVGKL